jgi:hypothetical protein
MLNKSSQLSSSTDRVAKALPLVFAKMSTRIYDYARPCLEPEARPTLTTTDHTERQAIMERHVLNYLSTDTTQQIFWASGLDNKTFYL